MNSGARGRVVAVCGKGGVGKTAFTAMMARALLESKSAGRLLVIDADPAMGLPNTLGISVTRTMGQVRESIIDAARQRSLKDREEIVGHLDYMVLESLVETDHFAFLAMGRTDSQGCFCPLNHLLRNAIGTLSRMFDTILIDGEAGLEQIQRQVVSHVDVLVILTDTSFRGRETVAHIKRLAVDELIIDCSKVGVVFNKVQRQNSEELLLGFAEDLGVEVFGVLPQDENILNFDLIGRPLMDLPEDSPALITVRSLSKIYNALQIEKGPH